MTTTKAAEQFIQELVRTVQPDPGCAIVVREWEPSSRSEPNWIASTGAMSADALARYDNAMNGLRRQHPRLNWDGIQMRDGRWRRVALDWSGERG
jgi:hypothetical protein